MHTAPTLEELKKGGPKVYEKIYTAYKEPFYAFAKAYTSETIGIEEAYQEAIISLYENVMNRKITSLESSLKTYLFAIGKYKLFGQLRSEKRLVPITAVELPETVDLEEEPLNDRQQKLKASFRKLGERCQQILELFYLNGYTISEIKDIENYENENTVKAQKSRCLRQLKSLIKP